MRLLTQLIAINRARQLNRQFRDIQRSIERSHDTTAPAWAH